MSKRHYGSTPRPKGFKYARQALHMPVAVAGMVRRGKIIGKDEDACEKNTEGMEQANKALWNHQRGQTSDFPLVGRNQAHVARLEAQMPKSPAASAKIPMPKKPSSSITMEWLKDQKEKLTQKSEDVDVEGLLWLYDTEDGNLELDVLFEKAEKDKKFSHAVITFNRNPDPAYHDNSLQLGWKHGGTMHNHVIHHLGEQRYGHEHQWLFDSVDGAAKFMKDAHDKFDKKSNLTSHLMELPGMKKSEEIDLDGALEKSERVYKDPTREEMAEHIATHPYANEFDEGDKAQAMHWFAANNHGGKSSNLYSALSSSHYRPGILERGPNTFGSKELYLHLARKFSPKVNKSESFLDITNKELLAHQFGLFKAEPKKQPDPNEPPPEENKAKHLEAMAHHAMHRNFHIHAAKASTDPKSSHWDAAEHHEKMFKGHAEAAGLKGNKKLIDQHLAGDQNPVFAEHPYDKLLVKKD